MGKRVLSLVLVVALFVGFLPPPAAAASEIVRLGGIDITTGYENAQPLFGGTVQYADGVLTLNNVTVTPSSGNGATYLSCDGEFVIEVVGSNTITGANTNDSVITGADANDAIGLFSAVPLKIRGNGSLAVNGADGAHASYGIMVRESGGMGQLTLEGAVTVSAKAGDAAQEASIGVNVLNTVTVNSGATLVATGGRSDGMFMSAGIRTDAFIANGGTVEAVAGPAVGGSDGIYCSSAYIGLGSTVTAKGGEISGLGMSVGFACYGTTEEKGGITVDGGTLIATGGKIAQSCPNGSGSRGIDCNFSFTVNGGEVRGNTMASESDCGYLWAIYCDTLNVNGGSVTGRGGQSLGGSSTGILCHTATNIGADASVTASGGKSSLSYGLDCTEGTIVTSGFLDASCGELVAAADNSGTPVGFGIYCGSLSVEGGEISAMGYYRIDTGMTIGIRCTDALEYSDGTVTATGNSSSSMFRVVEVVSNSFGLDSAKLEGSLTFNASSDFQDAKLIDDNGIKRIVLSAGGEAPLTVRITKGTSSGPSAVEVNRLMYVNRVMKVRSGPGSSYADVHQTNKAGFVFVRDIIENEGYRWARVRAFSKYGDEFEGYIAVERLSDHLIYIEDPGAPIKPVAHNIDNLVVGSTAQINYALDRQDFAFTTAGAERFVKLLRYTSNNPSVATVDAQGRVTAHKAGTAVVTLYFDNVNGIQDKATCTVTVTDKPQYSHAWFSQRRQSHNGVNGFFWMDEWGNYTLYNKVGEAGYIREKPGSGTMARACAVISMTVQLRYLRSPALMPYDVYAVNYSVLNSDGTRNGTSMKWKEIEKKWSLCEDKINITNLSVENKAQVIRNLLSTHPQGVIVQFTNSDHYIVIIGSGRDERGNYFMVCDSSPKDDSVGYLPWHYSVDNRSQGVSWATLMSHATVVFSYR